MSAIQQEICLADLIRVLNILKPDKAALVEITPMIGFKSDKAIKEIPKLPPKLNKPPRITQSPRSPISKKSYPQGYIPLTSKQPKPNIDAVYSISIDILKDDSPIQVPIQKMPEPLRDRSEGYEPSPEHYPLIFPVWTRAIMIKLLSTGSREGVPG